MPRIQFSDVTPPEKRSIRDIPIPNGGKRKVPISIKPEIPPTPKAESVFESKMSDITEKKESDAYQYYYPKNLKEPTQNDSFFSKFNKIKNKQWIFGTIAIILIAGFIVGMMTVFASASIVITPKSQIVDVDMKITATSDKQNNTVRYEVVKLSQSNTVSVPATGEEAAQLKASGKIVIYNNFSTEPQRLITRTRFETPEGLIYRISESVVVPGKTVVNGVSTPGSIEVQVTADEAGDKYNIKKSDFNIPGFKSDANRYKNFYARSSTDMTGGFIGKMKTILPADKQTALQNIETKTKANLEKDLNSKVTEGLTMLTDSIIYNSQELPQKEESSSVSIGKEVTAYVILLNTQDLSDAITNQYISSSTDWNGIKSIVKDFSLLKITSKPNSIDTGTNGKIDLQIGGKAKVLADIDTNIINQKLLGAPKNEAANLMNEFAGISSLTATIRPIWKQSFPDSPSKIHVSTVDN
jgi:hypothetical protein